MQPPTPAEIEQAVPTPEARRSVARRRLLSGDALRAAVFAVLAVMLVASGDPIPALVCALAAALFVIEAVVTRRRSAQLGRAFGRAVGRALAPKRR
jgi:hypothetical protein